MAFENSRSINIAKLILQETGTYNVMHHRPYKTVVMPQDLDNITRRVEESKNSTITGTLLAGIASNILSPSANPEEQIIIPNGWAERRIRFVMEVHVNTSMGNSVIYYFQGFTSHLGVTPTGAVDPNMEFYINSFLRVSRLNIQTPYGMSYKDIVTESAHVINGRLQHNPVNDKDQYLMRPQDVFNGIQSNYLSNTYRMTDSGSLKDTRIMLGNNEGVRSRRTNNLSANFLANVIDSYRTGINLLEFGQDDADILSRCSSLTLEEPLAENPFIRAINNLKGYSAGSSFTFKELEQIDPNIKAVSNYITLGNVQINQLHNTGQTSYWNGSDRETLVATILSNSIPAIMMELMISKIYFRSTNNAMGGIMNTIILDAKSLTDADISYNYQLFKNRIEKEIFYDITYGNQDIYTISMQVDLFGESRIAISLSGASEVVFAVPSFCDALAVPVITDNKNSYFGLVHDFEVIMNNVKTSGLDKVLTINNGI